MTPRYEAWREDKNIKPYLDNLLGPHELDERQQILFERGVDSNGDNDNCRHRLGRELHMPPARLRKAMSSINSILTSRSPIGGGTDPHGELGDPHWRGASHDPSMPDTSG